jgi:hypothetical protein
MLMQRWMGPLLICLALGGCCTDGSMCMKAPTSGPEMAWDGTGQPPDRDVPAKRSRHQRNEIIVGPLQGTGQAMGTEPDHAIRASAANSPAANSPAAEAPDEAAAAEAQLKDKIVICRGCMSKQSAARTDAVSPDVQATELANQ